MLVVIYLYDAKEQVKKSESNSFDLTALSNDVNNALIEF